jgi:pyridoxal phosphate enzyme (YggS family)
MNTIKENLLKIRNRIAEVALHNGRNPSEITLLAVCKNYPIEAIESAFAAGQLDFAENRVQELVRKAPLAPAACRWHLIGHLQRNKVRPALENAAVIHSIDSLPLLQRVNRIAEELEISPEIFIEVNISGEESKFGVSADAVEGLVNEAQSGPAHCIGLMTMAPFDSSVAEQAAVFSGLRKLRDRLSANTGLELPQLSMGMSGDYEVAIAEGATILRIGSAIFKK